MQDLELHLNICVCGHLATTDVGPVVCRVQTSFLHNETQVKARCCQSGRKTALRMQYNLQLQLFQKQICRHLQTWFRDLVPSRQLSALQHIQHCSIYSTAVKFAGQCSLNKSKLLQAQKPVKYITALLYQAHLVRTAYAYS